MGNAIKGWRRMKKWTLVILIICSMIILCSCWDMREINEIGMVVAIGIDKGESTNTYNVTAQIANPVQGEGKKGGSSLEKKSLVLTSNGKTIFEAIRKFATYNSRRVIWSHNAMIIIGESLAREDITPVMDFFTHNSELRMKTWIVVSKGEAKNYMAINTGMEGLSGLSLGELFRYHSLVGVSVESDMVRVYSDFNSTTRQVLMARVNIVQGMLGDEGTEKKQIQLAGSAVFRGMKMVGWLSPEETVGASWIRNQVKDIIVTVPSPEKKMKMVSVEIRKSKVKLNSNTEKGIPNIYINISTEGGIVEEDAFTDMSMDEFKDEIAKLVAKKIEDDVKKVVQIVQNDYESDVFGFGRIVHIQNKKEWKEKITGNWEKIYPSVPVHISVKANINSSTLNQIPNTDFKSRGE